MPTIAEAARDDALSVGPSRDVGQVAWLSGGETLGTFREGTLTIGSTRYRILAEKSDVIVVDDAMESRVLSFTSLAHGPATIRVANRRLRLVREHLVPILFHVTEDVQGASFLRILRLGRRLRFRSTDATAKLTDHELTMTVLASTLHLLKLSAPTTAVAAPQTPTPHPM